MDDTKEIVSFRHNRTDAHVNSQGLQQREQAQVRQSPSTESGTGIGAPSPVQEVIYS